MIYLDNAATTWPKPAGVFRAMNDAVKLYGANPGRGGYPLAEAADRRMYLCRSRAAKLFGLEQPEQLIYTPGCTWAINTVLTGILRPGDHVVISDLEHNAVVRPLHYLEQHGVTVSRAHVYECDPDATLRSFERALRRSTRMIFCTCASNVFGVMPPISRIGELCRRKGLLLGLDGAQAVGCEDITAATGAHFICAPAHKGLYGVMGLGLLALCSDSRPSPLVRGGTGSLSASREQPDVLPDLYESGTPPMPAICALDEGIKAIEQTGRQRIRAHELNLVTHIYEELRAIPGVTLYTRCPRPGEHAPLLAFNIGDLSGGEAAEQLARRGICVRGGYHCAYDAHVAFGTAGRGAVRVAPSMFTGHEDVHTLVRQVWNICKGSA